MRDLDLMNVVDVVVDVYVRVLEDVVGCIVRDYVRDIYFLWVCFYVKLIF